GRAGGRVLTQLNGSAVQAFWPSLAGCHMEAIEGSFVKRQALDVEAIPSARRLDLVHLFVISC
ncbi:MAG: hypothetical protein PVF54_10395, partial [Anaerolineae bacterium]